MDITWTRNGLMGDWRMFYGLYGGFLCHKDLLWTFVYFKNVLKIVFWTNLCLRVFYVNWCTWRMSCWYFGCFVDCILDYTIVWKCFVHLYMIYVYALHVGPSLKFCKYFELICCSFQDGNIMTCLGTNCSQKVQIKSLLGDVAKFTLYFTKIWVN